MRTTRRPLRRKSFSDVAGNYRGTRVYAHNIRIHNVCVCVHTYITTCAHANGRRRGKFSKNPRKTRYYNDIILLYDFIAFTEGFGSCVYIF